MVHPDKTKRTPNFLMHTPVPMLVNTPKHVLRHVAELDNRHDVNEQCLVQSLQGEIDQNFSR